MPSRQVPTHSSQPPSQPQNPSAMPPQPLLPHGGEGGIEIRPHPPINMQDLRSIAEDIKETLSAAILELRLDLRSLNDRVHVVERETERQESILQSVTEDIDSHTMQMRDMQRHLEDLDNRGRRHNLRIRGLPESFEGEQISQAIITSLIPFSTVLPKPLLQWREYTAHYVLKAGRRILPGT